MQLVGVVESKKLPMEMLNGTTSVGFIGLGGMGQGESLELSA
jgi:hypothetical protein